MASEFGMVYLCAQLMLNKDTPSSWTADYFKFFAFHLLTSRRWSKS